MKRLKLLILGFCLALSIPLAYFVVRTYWSLEQEEVAELRYFGETLFDHLEEELASLVYREESRAIDQYNYIPPGQVPGEQGSSSSPLSSLPEQHYILGYLQNNPDGSFQTPLAEDEEHVPLESAPVVAKLKEVNRLFNQKRTSVPESFEPQAAGIVVKKETAPVPGLADKYLDAARPKRQRVYLGQEKKRVEEITANQAMKIARQDETRALREGRHTEEPETEGSFGYGKRDPLARKPSAARSAVKKDRNQAAPASMAASAPSPDVETFQVEVDPMQSVFINDDQIFIFRRIVIGNQIYRQGFVVKVNEFLAHLVGTHFAHQPMAQFTGLLLKVMDRGREAATVQAGAVAENSKFTLDRVFPRPFSFLEATLTCSRVPRSVGRRTLNVMMAVLACIILMGLFAIYHSARAVVGLSERRTRFVSSVTHELKTPLTNIRMYIEMLEHGVAQDHEREQEYFRILGSESARLSRLINNVLEFSKLEKKQRHVNLQEGTLVEVIEEVNDVMQAKLRQEGFTLKIESQDIRPVKYDREAMIQTLINLIDNSVKFGARSSPKEITLRVWPEGNAAKISVSDTGPGIPGYALKKVFDDFYRVDSDLTRATGGTGIGLALVHKLLTAMGGSITVANNVGPGCTFTIAMPT